ncbi:hypothetical protein OIU84_019188 [Salix udensis]|uniref:Uncharacterized protein n=1 Tax=Salix udensis TaxID=889485 RepID=A0AAD6PK00_9ROSI|nr:hypothetical protein OIU84_019188 [Salix udensis]
MRGVAVVMLLDSGEVRAEFEAMTSEELPAGKQAILISDGGKAQLHNGPMAQSQAGYLKEEEAVHHQSLDVRVKKEHATTPSAFE